MAVDSDVISSQDEASGVVLELDVVRIVAPIVEVFGELWAVRC